MGWLLPLWGALFCLLPLGSVGAPIPEHTYENVKQLQITVVPSATVQISPVATESFQDHKTKKEEKTLKDLVGLLQDMVKNIPTKQPSPSVTADTVWMKLTSENGGVQTEVSQTAAETMTPEYLQSQASTSVVYTDYHTSEKPLTSVSHLKEGDTTTSVSRLIEDDTTTSVSRLIEGDTTTSGKTKTFDQLTNGALSSLVESLKNVKKLQQTLDKSSNKLQQGSNSEKNPEEILRKPASADILDWIDVLIETIKNAPSSVKNDPAVHNYIEKAESFLKDALELTGEAEKKLIQEKEKEKEKKVELETKPSQSTILTVSEVTIRLTSPSDSIEKKEEDTQMEMGKLKSFINLLYGFSPHLSTYAKKSPPKKAAEEIVERAMAVLNAIKNIFCGNPGRQSKQMLKQLSKEDMELVRQAMEEKSMS